MKIKIKVMILRLLGARSPSNIQTLTNVMRRVELAQGAARAAQCARDCLLQRELCGAQEFDKTVAVWNDLCDDLESGVDSFTSTVRHGAHVPAIPL